MCKTNRFRPSAPHYLQQYYLNEEDIPAEIILPVSLGEGMDAMQEWLSHKRGGRSFAWRAVRGEKLSCSECAKETPACFC
jgi:excinuclease UvrABC nuclease subunit